MLYFSEKPDNSRKKRQILVADDESVNRDLLGMILRDHYDLVFAEDGQQAFSFLQSGIDTLSLVLLDLNMPGMTGQELLRRMRDYPEMLRIPVIVLTADQNAEVECLKLGATDFIPKPYPREEVILTRIRRTIELSEDREIIRHTERDALTGLYSREYFYRYAEQFDRYHEDLPMDAVVVDVNHFHLINERYGKAYGDEVLRKIGHRIRDMVRDWGGLAGRRDGDAFQIYCPHRTDYESVLEAFSAGLGGAENVSANRVRLRMGIYAQADKSVDITQRFDHAKAAAARVRNSFTRNIGYYDTRLHRSELFAEQLVEDFHAAIRQKQIKIYYQPKYQIQGETPRLSGAEALIRWHHPDLGIITPDRFVPLFEENGLIQQMDRYIWRETAAQIRRWKDRFGHVVPVSVNVSRVDLLDPQLASHLTDILEETGLTPADLFLEITESAYTQDAEQILQTVGLLREKGFRIEMDDFGAGYSSLGMIARLPIDALKVDMMFIRHAFGAQKDLHLLKLILDIAGYLQVPMIAEGIETEEQLLALKELGCDIVQGYYFSRPVLPEDFEVFLS